ncbi:uncharacterized protein K452DRAFT_318645 [Aplosporella prunicola CBS 121167]|uniref:Uncharacterized protein n=1 Tax=Aplosporella prunicola CBS 121167 TaxID=1176127 RepID=A0A6A6BDV1_9PEZI|nr:uncharacterized protein K452DRAFT_318645 [Aplosporella prunicola CBS 121167]KAF2141688.1 hypothetical protein K452DRAFT_318645 [Aplosporella prunicola CBS 121167]
MAPRNVIDSNMHGANSDAQELDSSQVLDDMFMAASHRRAVKREQAQVNYEKRKLRLRAEVEAAFSQHEKQVRESQKTQLKRLMSLLERRNEVEKQLWDNVQTIQRAYVAHTHELQLVLRERVAETFSGTQSVDEHGPVRHDDQSEIPR